MSCRRTCDGYCCVVLAHHCDWQLNFIGKHSGNAAAASTATTVNWRWNGAPFGGAHSASAASALAIVNIYANINNWRVNTTTMWECCASAPLCKCNELNRSRNWNNWNRHTETIDVSHMSPRMWSCQRRFREAAQAEAATVATQLPNGSQVDTWCLPGQTLWKVNWLTGEPSQTMPR